MPQGTMDDVALEAEIGRLPHLSLLELRHRWKTLFGHPAPKSLRRTFLARAVAYQMQVEAYGGLSVATKRGLREIAKAVVRFLSGFHAPSLSKISLPSLGLPRGKENFRSPYNALLIMA